jgi:hypothetical protein
MSEYIIHVPILPYVDDEEYNQTIAELYLISSPHYRYAAFRGIIAPQATDGIRSS